MKILVANPNTSTGVTDRLVAAGKLVARAYREEFGEEPPRRQQFVDGAPRQVKSYRRSWLIDTLKRFRAQLTGG